MLVMFGIHSRFEGSRHMPNHAMILTIPELLGQAGYSNGRVDHVFSKSPLEHLIVDDGKGILLQLCFQNLGFAQH
jgi:hypothetical protein